MVLGDNASEIQPQRPKMKPDFPRIPAFSRIFPHNTGKKFCKVCIEDYPGWRRESARARLGSL
jgi:hypothetical protein